VLLSESHVFSLDRTLARFSRNTNCDNRIAARFPERKRVINSDHETKS
jgi:hypothetical protein